MKITLPFKPIFRSPMLNGVKVMTCRTARYGAPGDVFDAFGAEFELTHVMRMQLQYVERDCWQQEGATSREHFRTIWIDIHPRRGFVEDELVWAHCFKLIKRSLPV